MSVTERVGALLDVEVAATQPLSGGDICAAYRMDLADGRTVFVKTHPDPPEKLFWAEADGLRWLAAADDTATSRDCGRADRAEQAQFSEHAGSSSDVAAAAPVPAVLGQDEETLILEWIEEVTPSREAAARFGRGLARLHRSGAGVSTFGAERPGFAGVLPLDNTPAPDWATFYAERRIAPLLARARAEAVVGDAEAAVIAEVVDRMPELTGVAEPPARLHGDLWAGNLAWCRDGQVWLIDPAAYAGHREVDLAMLQLFGAPWLETVVEAYDQEYPLAADWRQRIPLYQLLPLLVHAILFGGGYAAQAGHAARRALNGGTARR